MDKSLKVLQLNCRKNGDILTEIMESGKKLSADLVIVQEPPIFHGWNHPGFYFIWEPNGRAMAGMRKDSQWGPRQRRGRRRPSL
jgi:hypothetical protein